MKLLRSTVLTALLLGCAASAFALTTLTKQQTAALGVSKNFALRPCDEHFTEAFFCASKAGPLIVLCQGMADDSDEVYWQITDAGKVILNASIDKSNLTDGLSLDDRPEHFVATENKMTPEEIYVFSKDPRGFSLTWTDSVKSDYHNSLSDPGATAVFQDSFNKTNYACRSSSIRQNLAILNR